MEIPSSKDQSHKKQRNKLLDSLVDDFWTSAIEWNYYEDEYLVESAAYVDFLYGENKIPADLAEINTLQKLLRALKVNKVPEDRYRVARLKLSHEKFINDFNCNSSDRAYLLATFQAFAKWIKDFGKTKELEKISKFAFTLSRSNKPRGDFFTDEDWLKAQKHAFLGILVGLLVPITRVERKNTTVIQYVIDVMLILFSKAKSRPEPPSTDEYSLAIWQAAKIHKAAIQDLFNEQYEKVRAKQT